jgi:hypothetical protein
MADTSQMTAPLPAASPQPLQTLQRALLESARQLSAEASRFARQWQGIWPDQAAADDLDACVEALRMLIDRLVAEFGRAEGPGETEAAGLIGALLGTTTEPGPLTLLQALTQCDDTAASLDEQQLLGEVDVLRIQLNALRARWQEYLSLITTLHYASGTTPALPPLAEDAPPLPPMTAPPNDEWALAAAPLPPNPRLAPESRDAAREDIGSLMLTPAGRLTRHRRTDAFFATDDFVAPVRPPVERREGLGRGLRGTLITFATLGAVLAVLIGIAYLAVTHLPTEQQAPAATPAQSLNAPPADTPASNPTNTPQPPPTAPPVPPTNTPAPPPTAPPQGVPGAAALAVNPTILLVPCAGAGAATLQLVNTGAQPLNWRASAQGAAGGKAGIALDVAQGHLEVNGVALINVTALARGAEGTISISYSGATSPTTVAYSVSC